MNSEEIVKQLETAYTAHNVEWVAGFWAPDIVAYFNGKKAFEGREALLEFQRELFAERITNKMKMTLRAASGNVIAFEWEGIFTDRTDGNVRYLYGGTFLTMRENRVVEWHQYSASYDDKLDDGE